MSFHELAALHVWLFTLCNSIDTNTFILFLEALIWISIAKPIFQEEKKKAVFNKLYINVKITGYNIVLTMMFCLELCIWVFLNRGSRSVIVIYSDGICFVHLTFFAIISCGISFLDGMMRCWMLLNLVNIIINDM